MQQVSPMNKRIAISQAVKQEKLLKAMMDRNVDVDRAIKRYHREWKSKYGDKEEEKPSATPEPSSANNQLEFAASYDDGGSLGRSRHPKYTLE